MFDSSERAGDDFASARSLSLFRSRVDELRLVDGPFASAVYSQQLILHFLRRCMIITARRGPTERRKAQIAFSGCASWANETANFVCISAQSAESAHIITPADAHSRRHRPPLSNIITDNSLFSIHCFFLSFFLSFSRRLSLGCARVCGRACAGVLVRCKRLISTSFAVC